MFDLNLKERELFKFLNMDNLTGKELNINILFTLSLGN